MFYHRIENIEVDDSQIEKLKFFFGYIILTYLIRKDKESQKLRRDYEQLM